VKKSKKKNEKSLGPAFLLKGETHAYGGVKKTLINGSQILLSALGWRSEGRYKPTRGRGEERRDRDPSNQGHQDGEGNRGVLGTIHLKKRKLMSRQVLRIPVSVGVGGLCGVVKFKSGERRSQRSFVAETKEGGVTSAQGKVMLHPSAFHWREKRERKKRRGKGAPKQTLLKPAVSDRVKKRV